MANVVLQFPRLGTVTLSEKLCAPLPRLGPSLRIWLRACTPVKSNPDKEKFTGCDNTSPQYKSGNETVETVGTDQEEVEKLKATETFGVNFHGCAA